MPSGWPAFLGSVRTRTVLTIAAGVALAAIGFTTAGGVAGITPGIADTSTGTTTGEAPILPNPSRTPGVFNRAVRQATIRKTICRRGWTKTIRPPARYTNQLKRQQLAEFGYMDTDPRHYEEDHLIPLELGGAPRNPRNLWPEPRAQSRLSDPFETTLRRAVCFRVMTLKRARMTIRAFKFSEG